MRKDVPLVSIGIPTYNRARTLRRSIESAMRQDYANIEIIVSDDASTDSTEELCKDFCRTDGRIRYIRQPVNRGFVINFSEVRSQARGKYFMWLSDDDWLDSTYVSECASMLTQHPDYVLVCGKDRYYRDEEFVFDGPQVSLLEESPTQRVVHYFQKVGRNGMLYGLMRREQLSTLVFSPLLGGDWLLMSEIAYFGKTRTLETVAIHRSVSGESGNLERHALRMGLTPRQARNPLLAMTKIIFAELGWKSPTYRSLGQMHRLLMAAQSSWGVFARYCMPPYKSRVDAIATRLRQWLGGHLDRHVLWRFRKRS